MTFTPSIKVAGIEKSVLWLGYGLDDEGFGSREEKDVSLFSKMSSSGVGLNEPPSQCAIGTLFPNSQVCID
jgi:hypothetical protein